jgi:gas vesicle protein
MSNKNRSPFVTLAAGIMLGGVIGATAALLAAPKPGVETRANLVEKGTAIKSQTITALKAGQASTAGFVTKLRERTDELSKKMKPQNHAMTRTIPEIQIE